MDKKTLDQLAAKGQEPDSEEKVKKSFLSYFRKNKKKIKFIDEVEALYDLFQKGKLRGRDKAILIGALIYFINPLDLIPDFTPIVGFTDDFGILMLVYRYLTNRAVEELPLIPPEEESED